MEQEGAEATGRSKGGAEALGRTKGGAEGTADLGAIGGVQGVRVISGKD